MLVKRFENKISIITGAASGIGKAAFMRLADEGSKVVLTDINLEGCQKALNEYKENNPNCDGICVKLDVTSKKDVDKLVSLVIQKYGRIDALAHAAGIISYFPFIDIPEDSFDAVIEVNLKGTLFVMQSVGRQMLKQKSGKICVVASKAAKTGVRTIAHYSASKFGIIGLIQTAAMEWGREGVYVNCVCPGEVDTPMLRGYYERISALEGITMEEQIKKGMDLSLIGRLSPPENIAPAIAFLLSEDSNEIIGQSINVDGGIMFY